MSEKLVPLADFVLIERTKAKEKTEGGIILPPVAQEESTTGQVLAVGPGKRLDSGERGPMDVKVGDLIMFSKYAGVDVEDDAKGVVLVNQKDIFAVLE